MLTPLDEVGSRYRFCVDTTRSPGIELSAWGELGELENGHPVASRGEDGRLVGAWIPHRWVDVTRELAERIAASLAMHLERPCGVESGIVAIWEQDLSAGDEVVILLKLTNTGVRDLWVWAYPEGCDPGFPPDRNFSCWPRASAVGVSSRPAWHGGGTLFRFPVAPGETRELPLCVSRRLSFATTGTVPIRVAYELSGEAVDPDPALVPSTCCPYTYGPIDELVEGELELAVHGE